MAEQKFTPMDRLRVKYAGLLVDLFMYFATHHSPEVRAKYKTDEAWASFIDNVREWFGEKSFLEVIVGSCHSAHIYLSLEEGKVTDATVEPFIGAELRMNPGGRLSYLFYGPGVSEFHKEITETDPFEVFAINKDSGLDSKAFQLALIVSKCPPIAIDHERKLLQFDGIMDPDKFYSELAKIAVNFQSTS